MTPVKTLLLALILAAVIVLPSSAVNVTYPQKYYDLQNQADSNVTGFSAWDSRGGGGMSAYYFEMQRQIILLEKQNELLAEQNALLANQSLIGHKITCTGRVAGDCNEWTVT